MATDERSYKTHYLLKSDDTRLKNYTKYKDIFIGDHAKAFPEDNKWLTQEDIKRYLICNFGALISKVSADLLFGEQVSITLQDEKGQAVIDEIIDNNDLHTLFWETGLSSSYKGDAIWKVRKGNLKEINPFTSKEEGAIIEYVEPDYYFPVFHQDNVNILERVILGWVKQDGDEKFLRREIHEKGKITNELWELKSDNKLGKKIKLDRFYKGLDEEEEVDLPFIPIFLIPNLKSEASEHFGQSDYADLHTLFAEINRRTSQNARILSKHSNPKLAVPAGVLDEHGQVRREAFEMFEVTSTEGGLNKPEYITWDGKLEMAFKEIDELVKFVFLFSEVSPDVFGLGEGGVAESGRALKFRLLRTLSKIKRKKTYFKEAIKKVIYAALLIEGVKPQVPNVIFQDGLPSDEKEEAEIREIQIANGELSTESAVRARMVDETEEEIQAEIDRIKGENAISTAPAIPSEEKEEE